MLQEEKKVVKKSERILTFHLDDELYGIEVKYIQEIIAMQKITNVPKMPAYFKGVINLRGNIIPVIDLHLRFEMQELLYEEHTAIIIISVGKLHIGLIVDKVEDVLALQKESLTEAPGFGTNVDTSFIQNMVQLEDNVIMILNIKLLFEEDELTQMKEVKDNHKETK